KTSDMLLIFSCQAEDGIRVDLVTGFRRVLFRSAQSCGSILSNIAEDLNYLVVLESIAPQDWAKPGADIILRRVKQQRRDGSVILLHDAGGGRLQTVEALSWILGWLHTWGDYVVTLSSLLGLSGDGVMSGMHNT